jgi:hypothetical protein
MWTGLREATDMAERTAGRFGGRIRLADPILALPPVMDLGTAKDRNCAALNDSQKESGIEDPVMQAPRGATSLGGR